MKLNFYQAWHYHRVAKIEKPFKLWIKEKPQGKMQFFGEWEDNGMYDIPEADDNEEFQKWLLDERIKMKKEDMQIEWEEHEYHGQKYYYGFYKRKESAETQTPKALSGGMGKSI